MAVQKEKPQIVYFGRMELNNDGWIVERWTVVLHARSLSLLSLSIFFFAL